MNPLKFLSRGGAAAQESDEHFENTVLLLHGDGTNGAQNNTFLDSSTNNFTITRNGNTTQGSFSPFSKPDGRWSNFFDGSGDYLSAASNAAFGLGTGDFTIEGWFYSTQASVSTGFYLFDFRTTSSQAAPLLYWGGSNWDYYVSGASRITGGSVVLNQWNHFAVSRVSGSTRVFINGTQVGSTWADSTNYINSPVIIGASYVPSAYLTGFMSNFRIVKGTGLYSSNFTPSTTPLTAISGTSLLTCQSNRFKDNSSNNFTITRNGDVKVTPFSPFPITTAYDPAVNGGSGYFDGSGDYLTAANNAAFNFGTGDFTVEVWVYITSFTNGSTDVIVSTYQNSTNGWTIGIFSSTNKLYFAIAGDSGQINDAGALPLNQWVHLAAVRSGTTMSFFVNGTRAATATNSTNNTSTSALTIGTSVGGGALNFNGYMSGLRVVKGTSVYDPTQTTLTVPTAPPTAISNTSVLLNYSNAGIFDNTGFNNLETVGNAQIDTSVKKFGTGAMKFDGSGDYLNGGYKPEYALGSGPFTVEFWLYVATAPTAGNYYTIYTNGSGNAATTQFSVGIDSNRKIYIYSNNAFRLTTATAVSLSTWTHVAIVRSGTTVSCYLSGTADANTWTSVTNNFSEGRILIGTNPTNLANENFNGFIDDLRITKGIARYTANFTPPAKAFPDIGA